MPGDSAIVSCRASFEGLCGDLVGDHEDERNMLQFCLFSEILARIDIKEQQAFSLRFFSGFCPRQFLCPHALSPVNPRPRVHAFYLSRVVLITPKPHLFSKRHQLDTALSNPGLGSSASRFGTRLAARWPSHEWKGGLVVVFDVGGDDGLVFV